MTNIVNICKKFSGSTMKVRKKYIRIPCGNSSEATQHDDSQTVRQTGR